MASSGQLRVDFTLSMLVSVVVFSSIWSNVEGRGNLVRVDSSGTKDQVCKSRQCIDAANVIYANRDTSVGPCENFYEFVCGGWIKNNPVPENKTRWDMFQEAAALTNERLKDILEKTDESNDNDGIKSARKFYRACLDVDNQVKRNVEILLERFSIWGGWPMATNNWRQEKFDWKKLMVHLIRTYDVSPLLQITVDTDRKNTSRNVLTIDQASTACSPFMGMSKLAAWKDFITKTAKYVAKASGISESRQRVQADVINVMRFHLKVCQSLKSSSEQENDFERYNLKTIAELENLTDEVQPLKEDSQINWLDLFNDFLEGAGVDINEDFHVVVKEPDFIQALISNIDNVSQRTLANYMLWELVFHMHKNISPALRQLGYDFTEKVTGATGAVPRWQTCVDETNSYYWHALGYEYVHLYFDADAKKNAEELVSNIRDSFIEELKEIDWMDGETRAAAIDKARNLVMNVGYPEWYDNVTNIAEMYSEYVIGTSHILNVENIVVSMSLQGTKSIVEENDRESWTAPVAMVNAFYSVETNAITIPAGIFQPPFYVKGRPEALNYGAIGAVIGHEISHAFDAQGRMADKFGNLAQWWSADTLKTYLHKQDCIQEQYSQYPVPELQQETEDDVPEQLDGVGTVSENIADNGGVQEAYAAYLKCIHQHGTEPRLPGLIHYSPQQLFYIGYTAVWCESGNQKSLVQDILSDVHSPSKYRVLIPLGNSKEFAIAWKCRQNDFKMNPVQKCQFW